MKFIPCLVFKCLCVTRCLCYLCSSYVWFYASVLSLLCLVFSASVLFSVCVIIVVKVMPVLSCLIFMSWNKFHEIHSMLSIY
jgi:hypothetical protein